MDNYMFLDLKASRFSFGLFLILIIEKNNNNNTPFFMPK